MAKSRKRSRNEANANSTANALADAQPEFQRPVLGDNVNALPGSRKKRPPPPPADNELDLEKLIFGGSSSLLSLPSTSSNLATVAEASQNVVDDDDDQDNASEPSQERAADDDLFMVDTAGGDDDGQLDEQADRSSSSEQGESDDDEQILIHRAAASSSRPKVKKPKRTKRCVWTDPDDAALTIDLTRNNNLAANGSKVGVGRLRRLREEVGESKISGLEYELRLRAQFEKLHPRPGWASFRLTSLPNKADDFQDGVDEAVIINEDVSKGIHDLLRSDTGLVEGYGSKNDESTIKSVKARGKLKTGDIELDRLRNANDAQNAHAIAAEESLPGIEMVRFHPSPRASVLMTASRDRRVRLFQIDGKTNPLVQTIHVPDLPIQHASFHPSGSSVLISGNRPFLFAYDLQAGRVVRSIPWRGSGSLNGQSSAEDDGAELRLSDAKFQPHTAEEGNRLLAIGGRRGVVHLLDWGRSGAAGGTRIGGVRMNSPLAGFSWDAASVLGDRGTGIGVVGTGKDVELLTMSTEGSVHLWDIRNMGLEVGCTSIWNDPGSFGAKGLEVSPNGRFWTVGSDGGIVNIYKRPTESCPTSLPTIAGTFLPSARVDEAKSMFGKVPGGNMDPVKTIENLVTATSTMRWNGDGQILAVASKAKKDALRLVHFPSMRVFSNWPTSGTPLGSVSSVDFSPASQYVAIGNTRGKVLLYSLRHYL
ncbi:related to UTP18 - possible U3 snoRNP protein involved in maturation of pre-18S rRNA [Melanopsichium pennsylvanicum]|uniref:Related to UTP18 - possible U3 snoRNP protein involved in maturation of pre-18S rRNA n=2 Tax=Melanopsichium pennsylvanicum TaxID=63383 RepID=A0AAJ4XHD9_9BASI|nr:wd40 repeat-like protein [Melanopsichium pennsylvanicum 4]SNX82520.1 related to UTP18 - possible U3 snoRNP protein involved in maturation of pre-18S rRNA [Melanopsichium pennsylvanicum]